MSISLSLEGPTVLDLDSSTASAAYLDRAVFLYLKGLGQGSYTC